MSIDRKTLRDVMFYGLIATVVLCWPVTSWFDSGYRFLGVASVYVGTVIIGYIIIVAAMKIISHMWN